MAFRSLSALSVGLLCGLPVYAMAQHVDPAAPAPPASMTVVGLISIQPANTRYDRGPYLEGSLGGVVPGVGIALTGSTRGAVLFQVELSTTLALSGMQTGRLVNLENEPELGKHRDTLISLLPGLRQGSANSYWEYKGGISLVLGQSLRNGEPLHGDIAGALAISAGLDRVIALRSVSVVPTVRYYYRLSGNENYLLGLGNHIVRAGIGVRFGL